MIMINNEEHNDLCVGIDLGTTNSVLATINVKLNGDAVSKVVDVPRPVDAFHTVSGETKLEKQKRPTLPSCVYYRQEKNYEPLVGDFAKTQYSLRPHLVAKSIKSQMGNPYTEGLSPDIPDKTPAQVSARILKHLLRQAEKIYRCEIHDAVITVPANFDSVMCKATRDAAELAGIVVRNADGTERPVLLSEPNAVIYDLINQIHNGEIASQIIDLTTAKKVLVFDLGGGTLDITMHEIKRREDCPEVLKVTEIATNRYTLLGGDDFDEALAKAMFDRYLRRYSQHPAIVKKLRSEEKTVMPQLRNYAEQLKLDVSASIGEDDDDDNWGDDTWDDDDEEGFDVGGSMGTGYSYDDTFTKEEVEAIFQIFMGEEFVFEDYKRLETIKETRNIIYPILDVLRKAAEKLKDEKVSVDAVVVNGGMSKFYMVTDRLTRFFGFEPIVALDPDQSVARGAAVYHHYLHKYEQMKDDMLMVGAQENAQKLEDYEQETVSAGQVPQTTASEGESAKKKAQNNIIPSMGIEFGNSILNDSLYLGVKNGAVHEIIPTGAELPYQSEVMTGFRVTAGQKMIAIPIKSRNLDGSYRTIAKGRITFNQRYNNGAYVAFSIFMGSNKVITMNAWTCTDVAGKNKIEQCSVEIAIDKSETCGVKDKMGAPKGSELRPKEEINNLLQLCKNTTKAKNKIEKSKIYKRISETVESIQSASNKNDFAEEILNALEHAPNDDAILRLLILARTMGNEWKEAQKRTLASVCMNQLSSEFLGLMVSGIKVTINVQAIYTLGMCATKTQLEKLIKLHDLSRYQMACLYTHAKTRTELDWVYEMFEKDVKNACNGAPTHLQFSAYAIGIAMRENTKDETLRNKTVHGICKAIRTGNLQEQEVVSSLLALAYLCDQRSVENTFSSEVLEEVLEAIESIDREYAYVLSMNCEREKQLVTKVVQGTYLEDEEEAYLMTQIEKQMNV